MIKLRCLGAFFCILPILFCGLDIAISQETKKRNKLGGFFKRIAPKPVPTSDSNTNKKNKSNFPTDSRAIALKSVVMSAIPTNRHYREELANAIILSYSQRRYQKIWNHQVMPSSLHSSIGANLVRHGLSASLALNPETIFSSIGRCPVNPKDLAFTVAIADAGTMVKLGAVAPESLWPKWNTGDKPGENRWSEKAIAQDILRISKYPIFNAQHVVDTMAPRNWVYRELQNAFNASHQAKYGRLPFLPNPASSGVARPGKAYSHAPALAEILVAKGFLTMPQFQQQQLTSVTPELTKGIKAFQKAHGLTADGIMGSGTWRKLNGGADSAQYTSRLINLHRARLLGDELGDRYVIVNIPSAELYGFENGKHAMTMRIVHGKNSEEDFHTPVFRDVMKEVVFAPYWNVPESISTKEIYPKMIEDETYFERNRYEIVNHFDDDATIYELNEETLEKIGTGDLWMRQKPTGHNALGKVKFLLPNRFNIYLHDTPSKQYFEMEDRAQSHGCIRLASPPQLAEWVLADQGWDSAKVLEHMESESQIKEKLEKPVNVYITYFTIFPRPIDSSNGRYYLGKYRDVYQKDNIDEVKLSEFSPN